MDSLPAVVRWAVIIVAWVTILTTAFTVLTLVTVGILQAWDAFDCWAATRRLRKNRGKR